MQCLFAAYGQLHDLIPAHTGVPGCCGRRPTAVTGSECAGTVRTHCPVLVSHTRTDSSKLPLACKPHALHQASTPHASKHIIPRLACAPMSLYWGGMPALTQGHPKCCECMMTATPACQLERSATSGGEIAAGVSNLSLNALKLEWGDLQCAR